MPGPAATGFFGKLPCTGDFVQRRLPADFTEAWDRHFEQSVSASRTMLGGDWQASYHGSPIWRFVLAPGACAAGAWAGLMGPGSDRVGRCFPMVVATPLSAGLAERAQALTHGAWFDAAERILAQALSDPSNGVDTFDFQTAALPATRDITPAATAPAALPGVSWGTASHWRLCVPETVSVDAILACLWTQLALIPGRWCLWWSGGGGRVAASVLVTDGLPQPAAYAGFLDTAHGASAWRQVDVPCEADPCVDEDVTADRAVAAFHTSTPDRAADDYRPALQAVGCSRTPCDDGAMPAVFRQHGSLAMLAVDLDRLDSQPQAAAAAHAVADELAGGDAAQDMQALRSRLLALHAQLQQARQGPADPAVQGAAVIAARIDGNKATALRIGAASAWHWRQGELQPLFPDPHRASAGADAPIGDGLDDLLFAQESPPMPGLGTMAEPVCDVAERAVAPGDRLLLAASQHLIELSPAIFARALALPSRDEARTRIAAAAGLGATAAECPLAIIEVES